MNDPREEKLPVWTRDLLADLRKQVATAKEPLARELAGLRPRFVRLVSENEAHKELLECAARGGHKTAGEIMKIIEAYGFGQPDRIMEAES